MSRKEDTSMERITADIIADKEFTIETRGYNRDEVDGFLDLICEELDRQWEKLTLRTYR